MKKQDGVRRAEVPAAGMILMLLGLLQLSFFSGSELIAAEAGLFPFKAQTITARPKPEVAGAHGFIRVEGDQFVNDAGPIRFWGVNLCMKANFPEKEEAVATAKRMADFGINIVRLHHMDLREIWGKNYPHQTELDPDQMARLDWLIYQFKLNGIYVNINLHVSKKMREEDGFTDYDNRPNHDKGIDNYEPRLIKLQKKYAKDLLTHVNPYTKTSYLNEPAVAMIEINNENSVVASYLWWALDKQCPEVYAQPLKNFWNQWIKKKYGSSEQLRKAWKRISYPIGSEMLADGSFGGSKPDSRWQCALNGGGEGDLTISEGALLFNVKKNGINGWEPQIYYRPIEIKKDLPYTITFRAKADREGQQAELSIYPSDNIMQERFTLTKDWKEYSFVMQGVKDIPQARIGFTWVKPGKYWFDDLSVKSGGTIGLPNDESIEKGNIHLIKRTKNNQNMEEMRSDFVNFLIDLEDGYWQEMFRYVKDDLKARPPVTGTQLHYGTAGSQGKLDYVDIHSYWNHPSFPEGSWDGNNWYVMNDPLVNVLGTAGSLAKVGATRVVGRPYTVSEYNHPYPNFYGVEGFPMIAALAGFQDWSGIFTFGWSHTVENHNSAGFFDIQGNPAILVHFPACYNMFVRGDVQSGLPLAKYDHSASIVDITDQAEREAFALSANGQGDAKNNLLEAPLSGVFRKYSGIRLTDLKIKENRTAKLHSLDNEKYMKEVREKIDSSESSTGELLWNAKTENKGYFIVDTDQSKVFSGFVNGRTFTFKGGMKLIPGKSLLDWMTITATEIDSNHWLIAATGLIRNTNSKIRVYKKEDQKLKIADLSDTPTEKLKDLLGENITYCRTAGGGPVLVEGISAKFILPLPYDVNIFLCPLDENGKIMKKIPAKRLNSENVEIEIGPQYKTLWYEVILE